MDNTALVIGATGLVGKLVLLELSNNDVNIFAVTRSSIEYPNVSELDFDLFIKDGLLPACKHIYICLGTTIKKAGSQDEFRKIDFDYSLAFAKKARKMGASKISLVSSVGANHNSKNFYLRVKGELEEAIKKIDFDEINIYRPSLLIGNRTDIRVLEKIGQHFSFIINFFLWGSLKKYRSIRVKMLSKFMVNNNHKSGLNYYYYEDFK
jgi:uncharacterized protein YbjT (DUF2867 family)